MEQDAHAKGSTFSSCYISAVPIAPGFTHYSPFHSFVFENSPCSDMYESISKRWHFTLPIRQTLNKKSERVSSSSQKVSEYKHLYEKIKSLLSLSSLSSWLLWEYLVVVVDGCLVVSVWFLCVWQSGCMCVHVHRWFHHMLQKKWLTYIFQWLAWGSTSLFLGCIQYFLLVSKGWHKADLISFNFYTENRYCLIKWWVWTVFFGFGWDSDLKCRTAGKEFWKENNFVCGKPNHLNCFYTLISRSGVRFQASISQLIFLPCCQNLMKLRSLLISMLTS